MKILFDNNIPRPLRRSLSNYRVATAAQMGWAELSNGRLLDAAEDEGFDLFITGDKNLVYQQNLTQRKIALIVLSENNWKFLKHSRHRVVEAVQGAAANPYQYPLISRVLP